MFGNTHAYACVCITKTTRRWVNAHRKITFTNTHNCTHTRRTRGAFSRCLVALKRVPLFESLWQLTTATRSSDSHSAATTAAAAARATESERSAARDRNRRALTESTVRERESRVSGSRCGSIVCVIARHHTAEERRQQRPHSIAIAVQTRRTSDTLKEPRKPRTFIVDAARATREERTSANHALSRTGTRPRLRREENHHRYNTPTTRLQRPQLREHVILFVESISACTAAAATTRRRRSRYVRHDVYT